ncbi:MAG TPA: transcriptional regulator NrdR [Candidatus Limnocylindrales bacterium]|nr:transcriptional regulator NrdR [Candidatus Limnocylindrales bacterium]
MRCPFCQHGDDRVVDSRESGDGSVIRRRRECLACARRYTTYERVDVIMPLVVKKDGRREAWDREKLLAGFQKACEKRPVSADAIDDSVAAIERAVQDRGVREIASANVGEQVMESLKRLDEVAYVRFASVYRSFRDISEFQKTVESLVSERRKERGGGQP